MSTPITEYLSLQEVADRWGVSSKTVRRRIAEGKLPAYRSGRLIRVRSADADEMMQPVNPWAVK